MMKRYRFRILAGALLALSLTSLRAADTVPARFSDQEFWKIVSDFSEPNGSFASDNLLSNEARFQYVIPELVKMAKPGRAFVGVGPEQNFTYIVALNPSIAFIIDIRRANLDLQLMYKALFELSADRADFVSRLFSRRRPEGLRPRATAAEIFAAYTAVKPSDELYLQNLRAVTRQLVTTHGFALAKNDLDAIEGVYDVFHRYGPSIQYSSSDGGIGNQPSYLDLMVATDMDGRARSFLASEDSFQLVKDLETRNMIVPLVGDFAGPKAIRSVGAYLRGKGTTVSAFYVSNVEQYLRLFRNWNTFCGNVQALPLDETSAFIRAGRGGRVARGNTLLSELVPAIGEVRSCAPAR